ncbi:MAG: hypothetical protein HY717_14145, partial [Planctomycetes bacterium]|nr:hypothetical protein [Planctomycetota bacterium]
MRGFGSLILIALLVLFAVNGRAQNTGSVGTKENLDLPFDATGQENEDEEAPPTIIFYGQTYEGDGIFYCLDRSSSTADGELAIEKRETIRNISEFSERVQFAIVMYDQGVMKWPTSGKPADANQGFKSAAIGFLSSVQPGHGTCVALGLTESLNFANQSTAKRTQIILLTDGCMYCAGQDRNQYEQKTLAEITGKNYKRHKINTLCVGGNDVCEFFPKTLAAMNGGSYK